MSGEVATEVAPGVHRIPVPYGGELLALHLLVGADAALLVDVGVRGSLDAAVLPYMRGIGVAPEAVRTIVVTHADVDHCGDLAAARERFPRAEIVCHARDRALIEDVELIVERRYRGLRDEHGIDPPADFVTWAYEQAGRAPVDRALDGPERWALGPGRAAELVLLPGHTPGHVGVLDPDSGVLVAADAILGAAVPDAEGAPLAPPLYVDAEGYRATVARIRALAPTLLLTAHFPPMGGEEAGAFVDDSEAFADAVDRALRGRLQAVEAPASLAELNAAVADELRTWSPAEDDGLAHTLLAHLEAFERTGAARRESAPAGPPRWASA